MTNSLDFNNNDNTVFMIRGQEMLRINSRGFWVNGVKVKQEEQEAEEVYKAFRQWLAWNLITT